MIKIILSFIMNNLKGILVFLFAIIFLNEFKNIFKNRSDEDLDKEDKFKESDATLTKVQAQSIADGFFAATVTEGLSNTFEMVKPLFERMQNQDDFNAVYNAFGRRQYSMFWGNAGDPVSSDKHDLLTILNNEITSNDEKQYIRINYPNIKIF